MALALSASLVPSTSLGRPARPARQAAASRPVAWLLGGRRGSLLRVQAELKDEDKGDRVGREDKRDLLGRDAFKTSPTLPAFTRRREHTVGRVAAMGFAFSLIGELLTGIGPVSQLHLETGLSYKVLYVALLALAGWGLLGAALPVSPTFDPSNLRDVQKRQKVNPLKNPRKFLVQNEVLVGRLAMAGFAGACVLEYLWGGEAPLAHLGLIQPGTQLFQGPWWAIGLVGLFMANGLGLFSALGDRNDNDVY